jgi:hypothetical protein
MHTLIKVQIYFPQSFRYTDVLNYLVTSSLSLKHHILNI